MKIELTSDITVTPIQHMGGDYMVVAAARVSTCGQDAIAYADPAKSEECAGLINYLVKHRHGTPFEHAAITFFVHAPIFVFREWHRHRIGHSYNEESARYKQLDPVFWIPKRDRKLVPTEKHTSARPDFGPIPHTPEGDELYAWLLEDMEAGYTDAYTRYQRRIDKGFAKEVARAGLPVGIFSSCWVTVNPRSLMAFLSLRTHDKEATFVSYPQAEIEEAAKLTETIFAEHWPITAQAFAKNGRVGP